MSVISKEKKRWNKKSDGRKPKQQEVKDGNGEEVLRVSGSDFCRDRSGYSALALFLCT